MTPGNVATESAARDVMRRLPSAIGRFLRRLGRLADEEGLPLYLVGGVVRDLLLSRRNWDLDLTVEGDGIAFARRLAERHGAGLALFERFATARLVFPNGLKIDIASTRRESYANPAALPDVMPASLDEDLFRRDFTINAMAIQLNRPHWGELRDPYGGQRDLKYKVIRVLHERSFIDDPTRIFRALRFVERFGFRIEPRTDRLLAEAAQTTLVASLSGPRLANEIFALAKERHPHRALGRIRRLCLLRFLHPSLTFGKRTQALIAVLPRAIERWTHHGRGRSLDRALLCVMALLAHASPATISGTIERLQLSAAQSRALGWAGRKTSRIVGTLSAAAMLPASRVYRLLSELPDEALALVLAKGLLLKGSVRRGRLLRRVSRFLRRDRHVSTTISGEFLKELGLGPGPHFKKILDRLLDERLDGRITTGKEERDRARTLAERYGYRRCFRSR